MNKLKTIRLNHAASARDPRRMTLAILLLGATCTISSLFLLYMMSTRVDFAQADINRLQQRVMPAENAGSSGQPDTRKHAEIMAVRVALAELAMPWEVLFKTLEGLKLPGISVVSVEPDARQGKVRIVAKAADTTVMLAYVNALESLLMLRNVFLLTHESDSDNHAMPISFNVEATWEVR